MKWAAEQENKSRRPSSSSPPPSSFFSTSRLLLFSVGSSRSSTSDSTRETTHVCARERACTLEKKEKKEEEEEGEREKEKGVGEKEKNAGSRYELLLVEKLEVFARCVSKQFCLLIGGVKGRKATPTLPSPPLPRLRNYRRAVLFERLSLPGAGIKDVNARHLASLQGKSAGTAFHSGVNLMKRSFHLSRAPL